MPAFPLDWEELRDECVRRDERQCQVCGSSGEGLYVVSVDGDFGMKSLETRCREHCPEEWLVSRARVDGESMTVDQTASYNVERVDDGSLLRLWLLGSPVGDTRYPDTGGYRGFLYPWGLVQFLLGIAVIGAIGIVPVVAGIIVLGSGNAINVVEDVLTNLGSLTVWAVFSLVYLVYLLRRDYLDGHWPGVRWVPMDEAVLRRYAETVVLLCVGGALLAVTVAGLGGLLFRIIGEVIFVLGLALTVLRMNYVIIRGLAFDEFEGLPFTWEWGMRVSALLVLVDVSVGTIVPFSAVAAVPVLIAVGFALRAHFAGIRWQDPRERDDTSAITASRRILSRWQHQISRTLSPLSDFIGQTREQDRAEIDDE